MTELIRGLPALAGLVMLGAGTTVTVACAVADPPNGFVTVKV